MMRAATVRMQDATEPKYLGASSGITTTRLVMQLAKQFTDSKSIREIVPDARAKQINDLYRQEQAKPTSKVYPITSNVAAPDLPNRGLAKVLVDLYRYRSCLQRRHAVIPVSKLRRTHGDINQLAEDGHAVRWAGRQLLSRCIEISGTLRATNGS
jgi:hypothetical protein